MPLIHQDIPNLFNGISQQPPVLRRSSQAELQVNCHSSVAYGLLPRSPSFYVAKLSDTTFGNSKIHTINRDATERYIVVITNGDLKVFDFMGNEKTVNFPSGKGYLTSTDAKNGFELTTIKDVTFVANREVTTAIDTTKSTVRNPEAMVFVNVMRASDTYSIKIDGTEVATYTTGSSFNTKTAVDSLVTQLNENLTGYTIKKIGSLIYIQRGSTVDFTIQAEGPNDSDFVAIKDTVQSFSELPSVTEPGFFVKVAGSEDNNYDDHYVEYVSSTDGTGVWEETLAQDIEYKYDATTMPHRLTRESDGTFTFDVNTWGERTAGDDETNKKSSFIGSKINDIFLHRNRLGFLVDENVVLSENGEYSNFWRKTVTTVLDTDPIDINTSHDKISILRYAVPFANKAIIFSSRAQFELVGNDGLSNKTVELKPITNYIINADTKPVATGSNLFFTFIRGVYSGLREFFINDDSDTGEAADITKHVPKYIARDVFKMEASPNEDILLTLSSYTPDTLYVYQWYDAGKDAQRVQSAHHRWVFKDANILDVSFIEDVLYLILERGGKTYLERMTVAPKSPEDDIDFVVHLDRQLRVLGVYDPVEKETTWTLPFIVDDVDDLVVLKGPDFSEEAILPIRTITTEDIATETVITAQGDFSEAECIIGLLFDSRYTLSQQFIREEEQAVTEGHLVLRNFDVSYSDSGSFEVEVLVEDGSTYTYPFNGRVIGSSNNIIGQVALESGTFVVPVQAENTRAVISIVNRSYLPFGILNAGWEAFYTYRGQRL